ncbi:MAG: hypothetical protein BZ151_10875 [Desulfobacca sp. 4484_104]|nr:MAG: hypothetical protein BZ151_10875 [Desulfobacca sp. 4484_104]RLA88038.1 MAG: hypothetical protein DRG58_09170 [Deltaproteobacteria bacterium]
MKQALIVRGGRGIGDLLFTTPIPRLLQGEGYEVDVAAWPQNKAVYKHNPYVREIIDYPEPEEPLAWEEWITGLEQKYDLVINLAFTVEKKYLHKTDGQFGEIPTIEERRQKAAGINYYDDTVQAAGFKLEAGEKFGPEIYLSDQELEVLAKFQEEKQTRDDKVVLWHLNGSTRNKQIVRGFRYLKEVLNQVPNSRHYICSGFYYQSSAMPVDERVLAVGGKWNLRTTLMMTKVADLVVGPESALVNAAGAWETPKMVFYSHSAPENLGGHWKNHYPICPVCDCHPCYLIPMDFRKIWEPERRALARAFEKECRHPHPVDPYRAQGFHCTCTLPEEKIVETAVKILTKKKPLAKMPRRQAAKKDQKS